MVTVERVRVTYNVRQLLSRNWQFPEITLTRPSIVLIHDATGWRIANLLRPRRNDSAAAQPVQLPSLVIDRGTVAIEDTVAGDGVRWPRQVQQLNGDFGLTLSRGLTDLTIRRAAFETAEPGLTVAELSGRWIARNGRHDVRDLHLRTAASAVDGQFVLQPAAAPRERASLSTRLMLAPIALAEFEGLVPALEGRPLVLTGPLNVEGPLDALAIKANLTDPQAGAVRGRCGARDRRHHPHDPRPARHHPPRSGADPQGQGAGQPPHVERPRRSRLYRRLVVGAAERHGGRAVVELDDLGLPLGQRARPRADRATRPHARRRRPRLRRHRHRERHDRARRPVPSATR